jgi:hypothetical protein
MKYLFRKDGTEYTKFTIDEIVDYIDRHGLEGLLKILKELDYPYFEEEWNRQVSSTMDTHSALTRYFNQLNLLVYRKFHWEDTEDKFKEKLISPEAKRIKEKLDVVRISREDYNTLVKDRLDFGFDSIYFRYSEAIEELSYYKEREAHKECTHFDRKRWADGRKMHFHNALEQLLQAHAQEEKK